MLVKTDLSSYWFVLPWQIVWALHIWWLMLAAASFAFSEADLHEQVHIKQAWPIFKIGTAYQEHAAPGQSSTHGKTLKWLSCLPQRQNRPRNHSCWDFKMSREAASHCITSQIPLVWQQKHGWIRRGWSRRRCCRASNQQPWHSKMPPNPRCSEGRGGKSPWITTIRQLQSV